MGAFQNMLASLGLDVSGFQSGATQAIGTINDLGDRVETVSGKLEGIGKALEAAFATGAIVEFGKISLDAAMEFDTAMSTISRRTGEAGEDLKSLGEQFETAFSAIPESADQVSLAMSTIIQRTGDTGDAISGLVIQLSELARFTGSDFNTTVNGAVKLFAQWKVATDDQTKSLDMLYVASQKSGLSAQQLIDPLVQYGAQLRQLGLSLTDATALIGSFSKAGLDFADVSRGITKVLAEAAKTGQDANTMFQGYVEAIKTADKTTGDLIAEQLVGAKSFAQFADAIRNGTFDVTAFTQSMKDSQTTLAQTAAQTQTLSETWQIFTKTLDDPLKLIGEDMTRVFTDLINNALKPASAEILVLVQNFEKLSPGTRDWIIEIALVATAVLPVTAAVNALATALKTLFASELIGGGLTMAIESISNVRLAMVEGLVPALTTLELAFLACNVAILAFSGVVAGVKLGQWLDQFPEVGKWINAIADQLDALVPRFKALDDWAKQITQDVSGPGIATVDLSKQEAALASIGKTIDKTGMSVAEYRQAVQDAVKANSDFGESTDDATEAVGKFNVPTADASKAIYAERDAIASLITQSLKLQETIKALEGTPVAQGDMPLEQYVRQLQLDLKNLSDKKYWDTAKIQQEFFVADSTSLWKQLGAAATEAYIQVGLAVQGIEQDSKAAGGFSILKPPDVAPLLNLPGQLDLIRAAADPVVVTFTKWGEAMLLVNGQQVDYNAAIKVGGNYLEKLAQDQQNVLDMFTQMGKYNGLDAAFFAADKLRASFDLMAISVGKVVVNAKDLATDFSQLGVTSIQSLVDNAAKAQANFQQLSDTFKLQMQGMDGSAQNFSKNFTIYTNDIVAAWVAAESARQKASLATGQIITDQQRDDLTRAKEYLTELTAQVPTMRDVWVGAMKTVDAAFTSTFNNLEDELGGAIVGANSFKKAWDDALQGIEKAFAEFIIKGVFDTLKASLSDALKQSDGLTLSFQNLMKVLTGKTVNIPGFSGAGSSGQNTGNTGTGATGNDGGVNSGAYDPVTNPGGTGTGSSGGTGGGIGGLTQALGGLGATIGLVVDALSAIVQGFQMARLINLTGEIEVTTRSTFNQVFSIQGTLNTWLPYLGGIQTAIQTLTNTFAGGMGDGDGMNIKDTFNALEATLAQIAAFFPTATPMPGAPGFQPEILADPNQYLYTIAQNSIISAGALSVSITNDLNDIAASNRSIDGKISNLGGGGGGAKNVQIFIDAGNNSPADIAKAVAQALEDEGMKF